MRHAFIFDSSLGFFPCHFFRPFFIMAIRQSIVIIINSIYHLIFITSFIDIYNESCFNKATKRKTPPFRNAV